MTTQHTPGEWYLNDNNREDMHVRAGKGGFVIAEVDSSGTHFIGNQTEAYANARLIAAAPDMLSVLIEAVECACVYDTNPALIELFQHVILKATTNK